MEKKTEIEQEVTEATEVRNRRLSLFALLPPVQNLSFPFFEPQTSQGRIAVAGQNRFFRVRLTRLAFLA
jgi:hypothetical protein